MRPQGDEGQFDDDEYDYYDDEEEEEEERGRDRDRVRTTGRYKFHVNKFDGESDYGTYKAQFDEVAKANRWSLQEKKTALMQALTGHAMEVITTLRESEIPITFVNLDEILTRQYTKKTTMWERKGDFFNLKQQPNQTLREFARIVERKGRAYLRNIPERDLQESLVETFCKGLSDATAADRLAYSNMTTLDEAVGIVSRASTLKREEPPTKRARMVQVDPEEGTSSCNKQRNSRN